MDADIWRIVLAGCVIGVVGITAAALKRRSIGVRVGLSVLAAIVVAGLVGMAKTTVEKALFSTDDDFAWSVLRRTFASKYPTLGDLVTLTPAIEKEFKAALVPVARNYNPDDPAMFDASAAATAAVTAKHVVPVAVFGSTDAINAWGGQTTRILRALAAISADACADFAMTGVTRSATDPRVLVALQDAQRALIEAYKTSDRSRFPMPSQAILDAQYAKATGLAQPPFSEDEKRALQSIDNQSKARQCSLMLRLFEAIDRLDAQGKAIIFRGMMSQA
jgi:hypothetical protein